MKSVMVPPVVKFLLDPSTYLESVIGSNGYVAAIEKAVEVAEQ